MSMSKKHFEALAAALDAERPKGFGLKQHDYMAQWLGCSQAIADVCARFNPNFDRARFLKACGVEESK